MIIRFLWILFLINLINSTKLPFERRRQLDELLRRVTRQCEQKEICQKFLPKISLKTDNSFQQQQKELAEIEMINCIRRCISHLCYRNIYEKDPLERGEIDARASQFKSCWIKDQK
jgi:hypothetical protein